MARAFGATAGAASTDIISLPCANGLASTRTISFHGFRNGTGDNDLGRYFDRQGATLCYLDGGSSALWIEDALTPTSGAYFLSFPTDAAWTVITIVHTVGSTPAVYYNGVSQSVVVSQAASGTPTGITTPFDIGNRTSPSSNRPLGGAVAEFGVWDRLLDANEVAALGGGMSPGCIPTNLVVYAPLIRDVVDLRGQGSAPTVNGTAVYPHPRVFEAPESAVLVPITATVTSVSGSLATTEPPDTSALAVTIANQATLASTDRPDAAALNATVANQAQLATTEPPDATAAAVTVANLVQLAATEAPDVAAISAALSPCRLARQSRRMWRRSTFCSRSLAHSLSRRRRTHRALRRRLPIGPRSPRRKRRTLPQWPRPSCQVRLLRWPRRKRQTLRCWRPTSTFRRRWQQRRRRTSRPLRQS
jgi:hypothetical protein